MKKIKQRKKQDLRMIKAYLEDYDLYGDEETYTIPKKSLEEQLNAKGGK